eukprot:6195833-Pleurochrysis_carterae.AAC.2
MDLGLDMYLSVCLAICCFSDVQRTELRMNVSVLNLNCLVFSSRPLNLRLVLQALLAAFAAHPGRRAQTHWASRPRRRGQHSVSPCKLCMYDACACLRFECGRMRKDMFVPTSAYAKARTASSSVHKRTQAGTYACANAHALVQSASTSIDHAHSTAVHHAQPCFTRLGWVASLVARASDHYNRHQPRGLSPPSPHEIHGYTPALGSTLATRQNDNSLDWYITTLLYIWSKKRASVYQTCKYIKVSRYWPRRKKHSLRLNLRTYRKVCD